ncbi:MAG: S9 family peptidase [Gammaproteobacteria bacterium]|nr:S9 family peptidase [Gammaproteobacteria bacterium]
MNKKRVLTMFSTTLMVLALSGIYPLQTAAAPIRPFEGRPPVAPVRPFTTDYFGIKVVDPYRYMENLKDPQVQAWFRGQNAYTREVLDSIPGRKALLARIRALDESASARVMDVRRLPGGIYFYQKRTASENNFRLYVRDGLNGPEKLVLDPDKYPAAKGSHNSISYYSPSWNGQWVAVGVSAGGSENAVIHIINVATGKDSPETIDRARFGSVNWRPDNHSFFYNRLQKLKPGQSANTAEEKSIDYLHVVGANPDKDVAVMGFGVNQSIPVAPTDLPFVVTAPGSDYAIAFLAHGVLNEVTMYDAPLDSVGKPGTRWQKICDVADDVTGADVHGGDLYLLTHQDAPRFRVVRTSLAHPDFARAVTLVPEGGAVINNIAAAADALYIEETDGVLGLIERLPYSGGPAENLTLPFEGTAQVASSDQRVAGVLLAMASWARAPRIYSYDPGTGKIVNTGLQPLGPNDNPTDIVSEEVKVKSWDGVMVPLSIVYKRGLKMDGNNPTLMRGYGSYGITFNPSFNPMLLAFLEKGGVYAVAHVRGGGEYGEEWHRWGMKLTKPNTWRDFIACAEYLIDHKFTSPARMAGMGTSAGGITIGRAITERPDLFAAAIDQVGVSDALREEFSPNGPPNIPEFGSVKTLWGFEDLYAMDAYVHVRKGVRYPAVLLTTGFNDPRVSPWEAGKMTARLQADSASGRPVLLRVDYEAGHGFGSTKTQVEDTLADEMSFLFWQFRMPGFQPMQKK